MISLDDETRARIRAEEIFRHEVRESLSAQRPTGRRERLLKALNSPLALWALSTLLVGLVTWGYGRWDASRAALRAESTRARQIATELQARADYARGVLRSSPVQKGRFDALVVEPLSTGNVAIKNGVFPELASRTTRSLILELRGLRAAVPRDTFDSALGAVQRLEGLNHPVPYALDEPADPARVRAAEPQVLHLARMTAQVLK